MAKKLIPLGDRVLIKPFTEAELKKGEKKSAFILPDSMTKEKSAYGKVLAIGDGKMIDGKKVQIKLNIGDTVIFSKYGYDEVELDGEELYLLKEDNILAILKS